MKTFRRKVVAIKFIIATIGKTDFVNVEKYANKLGYNIVFFNTPDGDLELQRYQVTHKAENVRSFTYYGNARIIFINNNETNEDKVYLLIHEIGHIELKHIGKDADKIRSDVVKEIEADAFAYEVFTRHKSTLIAALACFAMAAIFTVCGNFAPRKTYTLPTIAPTPTVSATAEPKTEAQETSAPLDVVYVTPSGNKFHRADCQYTKDKDCTTLARSEAEKRYSPCKVCKP